MPAQIPGVPGNKCTVYCAKMSRISCSLNLYDSQITALLLYKSGGFNVGVRNWSQTEGGERESGSNTQTLRQKKRMWKVTIYFRVLLRPGPLQDCHHIAGD